MLANILFFSLSCQADIVKWTDKEGRVHYSDNVPEEYANDSKKIDILDVNVITSNRVKTLKELQAAGIEITPELRELAEQEERRRELEKEAAQSIEKSENIDKQWQRDEYRRFEEEKRREKEATKNAVSEKCGRSAITSSEKNRCIKKYYKTENKCKRGNLTEREKKWCDREYTPR